MLQSTDPLGFPFQMEPTFEFDLAFLQDPAAPLSQKKMMLDVIFQDILPYRFRLEPRLFPDKDFYLTLLGNRENFLEIWPVATRFHNWVYEAAVSDPNVADNVVENLEQLRNQLGLGNDYLGLDFLDMCAFNYPSPSLGIQDLDLNNFQLGNFGFASPNLFSQDNPQAETKTEAPNKTKGVKKAPQAPVKEHTLLSSELNKPLETAYRSVITDEDHFRELDDAYSRHVQRQAGLAPEEDSTWPKDAETQRHYVGKMFEHVVHTDDFYELRKARERLAIVTAKNGAKSTTPEEATENDDGERPKKRSQTAKGAKDTGRAQARPKGVNKSDWELMDEGNTPVECLKAVTHHEFANVEIELLCWKLLFAAMEAQKGFTMRPTWAGQRTVTTFDHYETFAERWSAMCDELMDCKILVHSLTRADWFVKFASAPAKERSAKLSNDLLNGRRDVQNQVGREVIKEKTSSQAWTTSEDFEIRTRDGQVVCEGGKIGDKTRRQLAVRDGRGV